MGEQIRALDGSITPLDPWKHRPEHPHRAGAICLVSGFPRALAWGPAFTSLRYDAWGPTRGSRHPPALGQPARAAWPEIGDVVSTLAVADDGVGLPAEFDLRRAGSLVVQLVGELAQPFRARVALRGAGGTTFTVTFNAGYGGGQQA
jgi:hypothetical protein